MSAHYWKMQTKWVRHPAVIEAHRHDDAVGICVTGEHRPGECPPRAFVCLTPQEALAFASWVAEQADRLNAKAARAAARKAARRSAKEAKQ
jgi:hypothetical protein